MKCAVPPTGSRWSRRTSPAPLRSSRPVRIRSAPNRPNCTAAARPIPEVAPVITHVLPFNVPPDRSLMRLMKWDPEGPHSDSFERCDCDLLHPANSPVADQSDQSGAEQ